MRTKEEGVGQTAKCWEEGFNCAESVLRGVCHAQEIDLPDVAKMMATPFGGGIGRCEDVCGALAGGVMALGACIGRTKTSEDRLRSYDAAKLLYTSFQKRFDSVDCKVLNKSDFKSPEHRVRCGKYVREAASMTLDVLRGGP